MGGYRFVSCIMHNCTVYVCVCMWGDRGFGGKLLYIQIVEQIKDYGMVRFKGSSLGQISLPSS